MKRLFPPPTTGWALWIAVFLLVVYPISMVVISAIFPTAADSRALKLEDLATDRLALASANTLRLGVTVSLLSLFLGASFAFLSVQSRAGGWIDLIMSIPFLTPPFLSSLAWSLAVGVKGYFGRMGVFGKELESLIFSFAGLSLLMAIHYTPIVYFAVRAQLEKISPSLLWAALVAGGSAWRIVGTILLPLVFPALIAGGCLAFACAIEEYGTPLVIGNRIGFPVISTEIGRIVSVYPINLTLASALASLLLALVGAVYCLGQLLQRRTRTYAKHSSYELPALLPNWALAALWILLAVYALFTLAIPYGSMLVTSLLKIISAGPSFDNLTLAHYFQVLAGEAGGLRDALTASFLLALAAAAFGSLLGAACARKSAVLAGVALIPAATPAITLAVGFIQAWNAPWTAWLPLYSSALLVALFYTVLYLPYGVQYARAGLAAIPPSYEWAARVHGAGAVLTTRRIIASLLLPHCCAGAILIFSISFRELIGSVLLRPPGMQTVSTFILREFDQGSPATGMALGVIATLVSLFSISVARRLVPKTTQ